MTEIVRGVPEVYEWFRGNLDEIQQALEIQRRASILWCQKKKLRYDQLNPKVRALSEMELCPVWRMLTKPIGFEMQGGIAIAEDAITGKNGFVTKHMFLVRGEERICLVPGLFVDMDDVLAPGERLLRLQTMAPDLITLSNDGGVAMLYGTNDEIASQIGISYEIKYE